MKKTILWALSLVIINASTSITTELPKAVDSLSQQKADQQLKIQNKRIVNLVVAAITKKLPQVVDKYTTYTSIKNDGLTLISTYEINTGSKSDEAVINEDKTRMKKSIIRGICKSSKRFLESEINITYIYTNANSKNELFRFEVNPKTCINIWRE